MVTPTIREHDPMTVVGLQTHYEGDDSVFSALWEEFGERWDEFEGLAATDEAFGVITDYHPGDETFDYLTGVATGPDADQPADFETVEVRGGTYAVFETTLPSLEADYAAVSGEWLPESDYDRRSAPEFERYGGDYDPEDPDSPYEYFLPVTPR